MHLLVWQVELLTKLTLDATVQFIRMIFSTGFSQPLIGSAGWKMVRVFGSLQGFAQNPEPAGKTSGLSDEPQVASWTCRGHWGCPGPDSAIGIMILRQFVPWHLVPTNGPLCISSDNSSPWLPIDLTKTCYLGLVPLPRGNCQWISWRSADLFRELY